MLLNIKRLEKPNLHDDGLATIAEEERRKTPTLQLGLNAPEVVQPSIKLSGRHDEPISHKQCGADHESAFSSAHGSRQAMLRASSRPRW